MKKRVILTASEMIEMRKKRVNIKISHVPPKSKEISGRDYNPSIEEVKKRFSLTDSQLYNANGISISLIRDTMKIKGASIAFNAIPCEMGHTFRERSNHCVICKPSNFSFQEVHNNDGYFYIAGSRAAKVIKIGVTSEIEIRQSSLNKDKYAGISDWNLLFTCFVVNCGKIEELVKKKISVYNFPLVYEKGGKLIYANEIYKCSFSRVYDRFSKIILDKNIELSELNIRKDRLEYYEFPNFRSIK